ncbi:MAG TPA: transaldolase family protein [Gemmatimonadaceae bacterium]|nr:transaldolase family protein [Gemmatimonadaceae bacterium]
MKIFLLSVSPDEVRWAESNGLIDGVVTTPAMLARVRDMEPRERLAELTAATRLPVCASAGAVNAHDIYQQGRDLARLSEDLIIQVPLVEDAIVAIRRLSTDGIRVAADLVFNSAQALLAAKAGASMVSTSIEQLDVMGDHGVNVVREIRAVFDADSVPCDILAAHPTTAARFAECVLAGAHAVSVTAETLRAFLVHPLTDRGVDQLLSELARQPRTRVLT